MESLDRTEASDQQRVRLRAGRPLTKSAFHQEITMNQEIIVDLSKVPWKTYRGTYEIQIGLDGSQGPELVRARFPGREVEPHYHRAAQFQLLLDGTLQFPAFRMEGIAVHYTDHNVPYGPFTTGGPHDMVVVHTKPAGVQYVRDAIRDPALRKEINRTGRELHCSAGEVEWQSVRGHEGVRRKILVSLDGGPAAEVVECAPGVALPGSAARFGRYEFVVKGSAYREGNKLGPETVRFVQSTEPAATLTSGSDGATFVILTFDSDAAKTFGGSVLRDLSAIAS
jgi:hypothetical protein